MELRLRIKIQLGVVLAHQKQTVQKSRVQAYIAINYQPLVNKNIYGKLAVTFELF